MLSFRTSRVATLMIYLGTFLVSVLSFFTTYMGLAIFLDQWLALVGSLGLQTAMLGIAWNLIRLRKNRLTYTTVFAMVAMFSIFFSYVNFNTRLKSDLRTGDARAAYADAARPVVREYAMLAKKAVSQGEYQVGRLTALLDMEETRGWATVIDEGSNDPFLQSVIEGARRTIESWREHQGIEYQQGSGRGIILDYLCNWQTQVEDHLYAMETYAASLDSTALLLGSEVPVADQYNMINWASVHFPLSQYKMIIAAEPTLPEPPFTSDFVERPASGQQALSLVIGDLYEIDRLTAFSLIFAAVIDLMVIVMALCGARAVGGLEYVFSKFEQDATQRLRKLQTDDPKQFTESLRESIDWLRRASQYGKDLDQVLKEFETTKSRITLRCVDEDVSALTGGGQDSQENQDAPDKKRRIIIGV